MIATRSARALEERATKPTQEDGQPAGLVVVDDGHADGVEGNKTEHHQVEGVRLHHAADGDPQHALFAPQVGGGASSPAAEVHPGSGHAWKRAGWEETRRTFSGSKRKKPENEKCP